MRRTDPPKKKWEMRGRNTGSERDQLRVSGVSRLVNLNFQFTWVLRTVVS